MVRAGLAGAVVAGVAVAVLHRQGYLWPDAWVQGQIERSVAALSAGDPRRAEEALRHVLRRQPRNAAARWRLAEALRLSGKLEHAFLEYKTYAELNPDQPDGSLALARLLAGGGVIAEAEAAATRAIETGSADAEALRLRARLRARMGRHVGALTDLRRLGAQVDKGDAHLLAQLSTIVEGAAGQAGPPPARLSSGTPGFADDSGMIWPPALAAMRQDAGERTARQDWVGALTIAERARREYPQTIFAPWLAGVVELARGQPQEAERHFEEALAIAPRASIVLKGLAPAWSRRNGAVYAGDRLLDLAERDPGFAFAYEYAAQWYLNGRQPDRAEAALRAWAAAINAPAAAYRALGELLLSLDRRAEALEACVRGLERHPEDPGLRRARARLHAALGETDAAIAQYEALLRKHPDDVAAAGLTRLLANSARPQDRARAAELARSIRLDAPSTPDALDAVGWVLLRAGAGEALSWLEAGARAAPQDSTIQYHLGVAYWDSGRLDAARVALDRALTPGTPFPDRLEAQRLQRQLELSAAKPAPR